jgi:hypothetical protein
LARPPLVLFGALGSTRAPGLLVIFPCSHLPALFVLPDLITSHLYHGWNGALALMVIALTAYAYIKAALHLLREGQPGEVRGARRGSREVALAGLTCVIGAAVFIAFALPVLLQPAIDPLAASISILTGLLTAGWSLAKIWLPLVALPCQSKDGQGGIGADILFIQRPSQQLLLGTTLLAGGALTILLVFSWMK